MLDRSLRILIHLGMKNLLKIAKYYEIKLAGQLSDDSVKPLVKQALESVIDAYPELMDGVLMAAYFRGVDSGVNPQISFSVWMDRAKQSQLQQTKTQRDQLIIDSLTKLLKQTFGDKYYQIKISDEYR